MSCPPRPFLEPAVIENVQKCIGTSGVFVLNLVCRDDKLREVVLSELRNAFRAVCAYKLEEDVNEIVYCRNGGATTATTDASTEAKQWLRDLELAARGLNDRARAVHKAAASLGGGGVGVSNADFGQKAKKATQALDDLVEVQDFIKSLTL